MDWAGWIWSPDPTHTFFFLFYLLVGSSPGMWAKLPSRSVLANLKNAKWRHRHTYFWRPKMFAVLMDSRLLLPFIFLLCSLVCIFFLFSQQLLKPRRWWRGRPAMNLFWFWVFLCLQLRKQWQSQYSTLFCSFAFPSLFCVFFFWFVLSVSFLSIFVPPPFCSLPWGCLYPHFYRAGDRSAL